MLIVPGHPGKDLCDRSLGVTRRDLLRVGGSGHAGLSLGTHARAASRLGRAPTPTAAQEPARAGARPRASSWSTCKAAPATSTCGIPRKTCRTTSAAPSNRSRPRSRACSSPRSCPSSPQINDKFTIIRSMSYTPNGLFNHTAAIYQMMTGYTTDKVSPSGQLEPPSPKDFPELRLATHPAEAADGADAAVRDAASAAAREQRGRQGGTAGFLGKAYDPVHALSRRRRHGHGQDGPDQDRRPASSGPKCSPPGSSAAPSCATRSTPACRTSTRPSPITSSTSTTSGRSSLVALGPGPRGVQPRRRTGRHARPVRPQHLRPELLAGPPPGRGRHAGRRGHLAQGRQLRQPLVGPPRRTSPTA